MATSSTDISQTATEQIAVAIAKQLLYNWLSRTGDYRRQGFRIVIHVEPGQTQARIEWPPPLDRNADNIEGHGL